jgi:recombinational DNA repair protein RecR
MYIFDSNTIIKTRKNEIGRSNEKMKSLTEQLKECKTISDVCKVCKTNHEKYPSLVCSNNCYQK